MSNDTDLDRIATAVEKIAAAMPCALVWPFCIALGSGCSFGNAGDLRADLKKMALICGQGH
jgi:hypothetical protein